MGLKRDVDNEIYKEDWFHALSRPARELWWYLSFNHHNNLAGVYKLAMPYAGFEAKMQREEILDALEELEGEVTHWPEHDIFFVHRFLMMQKVKSSKTLAGARKFLRDLPTEVCGVVLAVNPILGEPATEIPSNPELDSDSETVDTLSIEYGYGIDTSLSVPSPQSPEREEKTIPHLAMGARPLLLTPGRPERHGTERFGLGTSG